MNAIRSRLPILAVLGAGLALRLVLAYAIFPGQGLSSDLGLFSGWATALARVGPGGFYAAAAGANYPPGYLYVLWLLGSLATPLGGLLGMPADRAVLLLLKLPPIAADLAIAVLLYRAARRWHGPRAGLVAAALYLFVPVTWYDSALWGQMDAVGALVMLAAVLLLVDGWSEPAAALAAFGVLVKPQDALALVIVVPVLVRRHLLRPGSGPGSRLRAMDTRHGRVAGIGGILADQGPRRLGTSAIAAALALLLPILPFDIGILGPASLAGVPVLGQLGGLGGLLVSDGAQYGVLTANAFNLWALLGPDPLARAIGASNGAWTPDSTAILFGLPAVTLGTAALCLVGLLVAGGLLLRDDRTAILLGFALAAFAFYALPTRVHERYLFPFFAVGALLVADATARALGYVAAALLNAINIHAVLASPLSMGAPGGTDSFGGAGIREVGGTGGRFPGGGPGGIGAGGGGGAPGIPGGAGGLAGGVPGAAGGGPGAGGPATSIHLPLADLARSEPVVAAVALGQTLVLAVLLAAWLGLIVWPALRRPAAAIARRARRRAEPSPPWHAPGWRSS